ncbi:MAG: NAD(P)-dependent oxidoreductase [Betaproteobacteria bacterium]|nr:NAD(P)-dependent oxidoreductase [Betaproteobacteria bacterium]
MSVLVIGGGLIGSQIARILAESGERPVVMDVAPQPEALGDIVDPGRITLVRGDVLDRPGLERIMRENGVTRVVHTAANPLLTLGAQENPYSAVQVNIVGTCNVLEAARALKLGRVVVASSNVLSHHLAGGADGGDVMKEDPFPRPATFYAATKQAVEALGINYARWCGVDFVAVRYGAAAGPWRGTGGGGPSNIFRAAVEGALRGEEASVPPGAMDWVYSKDAAAGAVLALNASHLESRVFNIAMGRLYDGEEMAAAVREVIPNARIRVETPPGTAVAVQPMAGAVDLSRSRAELGYEPAYDMAAAVRDYVSWYRAHRSAQEGSA